MVPLKRYIFPQPLSLIINAIPHDLALFTSNNFTLRPSMQIDTSRCNHGPNAACPNCRPAEEADLAARRCRNHGPNGSCVECIEREDRLKLRLKLQDNPHCTQVVVDYQAANAYQSYLQEQRFRVQRCGFLFGKYNDDGSSSVEAIYEPPQRCDKNQIVLLPDVDEDRVEKIASLLGFTRVLPLPSPISPYILPLHLPV